MSLNSYAFLYSVDESGDMTYLGTASLVQSRTLLVLPPASDHLRGFPQESSLRAHIVSSAGPSSREEVINGQLFVAEEGIEHPPVFVWLEKAATAAVDEIPLRSAQSEITAADVTDSIGRFVANAVADGQPEPRLSPASLAATSTDEPDGPGETHLHRLPDPPRPPWCGAFPTWPGCPDSNF
jgi:hypothetical protein